MRVYITIDYDADTAIKREENPRLACIYIDFEEFYPFFLNLVYVMFIFTTVFINIIS